MTHKRVILGIVMSGLLLAVLLAACAAPGQPGPGQDAAALSAQVAVLETRVSELQGAPAAASPDAAQLGARMGQVMDMMRQTRQMMQDHAGQPGQMMPMMGQGGMMDMGAMMGNLDQMMTQMQSHMQSMMGAGGMMGAAPMTGTMPMTGTQAITGSAAGAGAATVDTRTAEAGGVTVQVTPLNLNDPAAETLRFAVVMDTHSVDLGVDLAQLATLQAGVNEVKALEWQAPPGGGHHVSGALSFPAVDADGQPTLGAANTVTLVIRNLAGVPWRTFTWTLGGRD